MKCRARRLRGRKKKKGHRAIHVMEAASSSDEDDDASVSSSSSSSVPSSDDDQHLPIQSLEDLPSDDSVSLDGDSSDDNDSEQDEFHSQDQHSNRYNAMKNNDPEEDSDSNSNSEEEIKKEDMSLEKRLDIQRNAGLSQKSLKQKRHRKQHAVQKASEAMAAFQRKTKKGTNTNNTTSNQDDEREKKKQLLNAKLKSKASKHAPTEASSKRSDFFARGAPQLNSSGIGVEIGAHTYKSRDPRMENLAGHYNADHFERNYEFLHDVRQQEIVQLKQRMAARTLSGKKGQKARRKLGIAAPATEYNGGDQAELQRLLQETASHKKHQVEIAAKRAVKKKIREGVADGVHGAYYPKRRELKKMELEAKFDEMRKRGGDSAVDKALAKRRKKNKSKDVGSFYS